MQGKSQPLRHIILNNQGTPERFTTPRSGGRQFQFKPRDKQQHGQSLKAQLQETIRQAQELAQIVSSEKIIEKGSYIEFESDSGYELKVESLKDAKHGIKLVAVSGAVITEEGVTPMKATVFVPEGKIEHFIKKIEKYLDPTKNTKAGNPANQRLIESISSIHLATLKSLWTDNARFPESTQTIWWELWLRTDEPEERDEIVRKVRHQANEDNLQTSENELVFPDTTVLLVRASSEQLSKSLFLLNVLAEVRRAKELADYFTRLSYTEQNEWVQEAVSRVTPAPNEAPAVCLIDTGVNREHPLLNAALSEQNMGSYNPAWGNSDIDGHGTELAGLSLYGDLTEIFLSAEPVDLQHRLESVKLLRRRSQQDHESKLYGKVTVECLARAEKFSSDRQRVYCLATSAKDARERGRPSSWSAAIDQFVSGAMEEDDKKRLIVIAAGNADPYAPGTYPDKNHTDEIHDPAQSWNAVTVGAFTEKDSIDPDQWSGWTPLAPKGALCPTSTTSLLWESKWPLKPDVVFEGGNMATHPNESTPQYIDALGLLTTHKDWRFKLLTYSGDTSGAAALAARMCAQIWAKYPQFWPETIRGLLVHSAEWTSAMSSFPQKWPANKQEIEPILRMYGYGVPRLNQALYSARNSLTLIAQDSIQPFFKEGNDIKTNEMKLHSLPWPREILADLGGTIVEMKVTLSYFIESKPERNEINRPSRYMSHGLRFEAKSPTETIERFRQRINKAARDEKAVSSSSDADEWLLGPNLRSRGCLHSDLWKGTAVELAEKGHLAIYPVGGWWKELRSKHKYENTTRYSLIVTIKTPDINVDLYTPVANVALV